MACGTIIVPPLWRPGDVNEGNLQLINPYTDLDDWSWVPIEVPQYIPPTIDDLTLGAEPPPVPDIPFGSAAAPYQAPLDQITPPVFGPVPTLDATKPAIYEPPQPDDLTAVRPGDAPVVKDVEVPPAPVIEVPLPPEVSDVVVPEPIEVQIPVFTYEMPDPGIILPPDNTFFFEEEPYTDEVLEKTTSEILRMLNGGVGIPDTTWYLILQQGIEREEQSHAKLIETTIDEFASKGWAAPSGVLDMRIREARQSINNQRGGLSRQNTIEQAKMELDNLKYAISQGLALETILIGLHNDAQNRGLKAAELGVTIAIQIMEAKIALYNSELQAYQTAANVYKSLIDAEMTKVAIYKTEIEAAMLTIEVDKTQIEAYNAYINGLNMIVELHNSQVKTVLAQVEIEKSKVDVYVAQVQAYAEEVKAWSVEWDGYNSAWQGQTSKVDIYRASVDAYAAEVGGYGELAKVEEIKVDAEKATIELNIERMKSDTSRYAAEVDYLSKRSAAAADTYRSQMAGYGEKAKFESNRIDVYEAKLNADIANARATSTSAIENARLVASQLEAIQTLNQSADIAKSKINAQIEASLIGQFSASTQMSSSFNTSYQYQCTE